MADPTTPSPYALPHQRPTRRKSRWLALLLMYLVVPPGAYLLIQITAATDPVGGVLTSAVTLFLFWAAFSIANPRLVGLELIGVILATYYRVTPHDAVLWVTSTAIAAAVGVWLVRRHEGESHFFFLIPATAVGFFVFLVFLSDGMSFQPGLLKAQRQLSLVRRAVLLEAEALEQQNFTKQAQLWRDALKGTGPDFNLMITNTWLAMWILGLWIAGRISRRILGQFQSRHHRIALFKIEHPYIFLLIIGLVLEILNGLTPRWGMQWLAIPLLLMFAMACFIEGLAIVLFYGALQRHRGHQLGGRVWDVAGVLLALTQPYLAVLVGLSDVWFDFRRLHGLRRIDEKA